MDLYIVTGASRGIGEALAVQLLEEGHKVYAISRSGNSALSRLAQGTSQFTDVRADLSDTKMIPDLLANILDAKNIASARSVTLINNAGLLNPIGPIGDKELDSEQLAMQMTVNLVAPMVIVNCFIQQLADFTGEQRILNISSGAGQKPYFGWGGYCTSKAGLDMFTRCVGLEQASKNNRVKIISVAPGVVDTDMQTQIRGTSQEEFRDVERFIKLKEEGMLASAQDTARNLLAKLEAVVPQGAVLDIRDD